MLWGRGWVKGESQIEYALRLSAKILIPTKLHSEKMASRGEVELEDLVDLCIYIEEKRTVAIKPSKKKILGKIFKLI